MSKVKEISLEKKQIISNKKLGYYIPLIYIIIIVPLIVYGKTVELPKDVADFWKGGLTHYDFFNYYKSVNLIVGTVFLIFAYLGLFLNNKLPLLKDKRYYIPMIIYSIFAIASAILSKNKYIAIEGFIEMNQGIFVLLSYIILTFITMNYLSSDQDIKIIVYSFAILTVIEGILGLGQFLGHDFLKTSVGQWILSSGLFEDTELKFTFGSYTIYGTMYNTNFVGSFASLVLPLSIGNFLYEEDRFKSIMFYLVVLFAYAVWLGCNSRAGYLGILVSFIVGVVIFRKVIKKTYKKIILIFISFLIILIIFNIVSKGKVLGQFSRLNPSNEIKRIEKLKSDQLIRFEDVTITNNKLIIKTNKETLILLSEGNNLRFLDENERTLDINVENDKITFVDKKYERYSFYINLKKPSIIRAYVHGRKLDLYVNDGEIKVISLNNKHTVPISAKRFMFFDGRETFASNRGYIWSRSIPLLKESLLIGYGPDNFAIVFPQEDYVGRFNVGSTGMTDIVIDKPHNMYLQTGINTGVISLLGLMTIWFVYLSDSFKLYRSSDMNTFSGYIGAAVFLSIISYLVAGVFNDSVISVAPLFWILLGMGIGINRKIKSQKS